MNGNVFQNIFDRLQEFLPANWNKIIFFAGYSGSSYSMKYYVDLGDGNYMDCFSQPGADRRQLVKTFMSIDKELSAERNLLEEKWSALTMAVDLNGKMKTDFDYTDIGGNVIEYENDWKKRYL